MAEGLIYSFVFIFIFCKSSISRFWIWLRANMVAIHSDLNQAIVINWAILMWWPHTASGRRIKALRRRPLSGVFLRSSRKLQEPTPPYGDVLGATQHKMPPWLFTSKRRTSRPCHGASCDTVGSAVDDARRRAVTEFERWQRRATSNIDSLKLFATLNEAYPLICMIQKCLLACPPSQSDCEKLFSLLGLFQGIFMYCMFVR